MKRTLIFSLMMLSTMAAQADPVKNFNDVYSIPSIEREVALKYFNELQTSPREGWFSWGNAFMYVMDHNDSTADIIERYAKEIIKKAYANQISLKEAKNAIDANIYYLSYIATGKKEEIITFSEWKKTWLRTVIIIANNMPIAVAQAK